MSADITMDELAAEFERLSKVTQHFEGAFTFEEIREKMKLGVSKARRVIKRAVQSNVLEVRHVPVTNIVGTSQIVPRYFIAKKYKTAIRTTEKPK